MMHLCVSLLNLSILMCTACTTHQVPSEEGRSYCASQGGFFRELSAWDNKGVVELFTSLGGLGLFDTFQNQNHKM